MADPSHPILVVDDEEVKRYTITRTLRQAGFAVIEAATGADGLRLAPGAALVVLDIKLPDIDGYEVCRRLKADPATAPVPVLHLSNTFVGADARVQGLESGADAYLTNASEPPVLVATVRALLRMRRAEEQARDSARDWQATFDAIRDGVFLADPAGRIVRGNRALGELVGRPAAELAGLSLAELLPAPPDEAAGALAGVLATGSRASAEWADGGRWLHLTIDPVPGAGGVVGILADTTPRRRAEEALKDADRRKDEFLATLAHELRNPLAPIRNALHIQKLGGNDPAALERSREMMTRQLAQMVRLIDDLLDVSRITRGKIELRPARIDLADVVAAAVETSRPLVEAGRHDLRVVPPAAPVYVDADPTRLAQVVANLLNNSAKYTPDGGNIRVTFGPEGADAVVRVADDGAGIPADMLPRVWELFAQENRSLERSQGGLGIGLTLVKRLVELHGGAVEARSDGPGLGSEFGVRLPLAKARGGREKAEQLPRSHPPSAVPPPPSRRVLVVDDNVDHAETLAVILRHAGHEVRLAHDGPAGLAAAAEFAPDAVLLDIGLPGLDGYEVARRLRERRPSPRPLIIALTGWGQDEDRRLSRDAGFDFHLVKPIDPAELADRLAGRPSPPAGEA